MAREATFTFVPETQLTSRSSDPEFRVTITQSGMLYIPREVIEIYDLDKKYFKFYADVQKKAIAWKYFSEGDLGELQKIRKIGITPNGAGQISINKLLSAIGVKDLIGSISDIPVRTYKPQDLLSEEVNYIIVNEKDAKDRSRKAKGDKSTEGKN